MVLVQLAVTMQKNTNRSFPISLYKVQVHVDQRSPHKTRYTETIKRECEKELRTDRHRRKIPKDNNNGLWSKIKNGHMGPHEIAKLCKAKDTVNKTKQHLHLIEGYQYPIYTRNSES